MATININDIYDQELSDVTKKNYVQKLKYLEKISNLSIEQIMTNPASSLEIIKNKISIEPATVAAYITPMCKLFSITPIFMSNNKKSYDTWSTYLSEYNKKRLKMYAEDDITPSQLEKIVGYEEIKNKINELQKDPEVFKNIKKHLQYILLAMFLNIKPKRCDLGCVYVSLDGCIPKSYLEKNYIILNGDSPKLILNKYKTSKSYGKLVEPLSEELIIILKESFKLFPRSHLFISQDARLKNKPYDKNNSYSRFVIRVFENLFGKGMTTSLWRHVYISENIDFNSHYPDLVKNARLSGQSLTTQMKIYNMNDKPSGIKLRKS
jgi:hypothetical protein